ncbi:MAG: hypothetical protein ACFE91_11835 [Promethearchaeota archaeon]
MKNKRTIIIKNPHLRRIRNNLRLLLIEACGIKQRKLQKEKERIKQIPEYFENHPPELLNRVKELNDQFWEIERPLRASILLCPVCFQTDKDMTYNPMRKTWYCSECYEKLKSANINRGTPEEFP